MNSRFFAKALIALQSYHMESFAQDWWQPKASDNLTWQWQITDSDKIDTGLDVDVYDIDLFDAPDEVIEELHADGKIVICYFSGGTYEDWRVDWSQYFDFITEGENYEGDEPPFGNAMYDWEGERWLDIRRIDLLGDIMRSRLQYAVTRGCDAVEPDNMDAFDNNEEAGFDLTYADQLAYNKWMAEEAHALGLSVGLKNDLAQLEDLIDDYDWALNEECFSYDECEKYSVFTDKDKAVFGVEYEGRLCRICAEAEELNLSWMKKGLGLGRWRRGCDDMLTRFQCGWMFWL